MSLGAALALAGLVVDLIGAFILAIDLIGIDRVDRWGGAIKNSFDRPHTKRSAALYIVAVLSFTLCALFVALRGLPSGFDGFRLVVLVIILSIGSAVMGLLAFGVILLAISSAGFLLQVQKVSQRGTLGLFGFALLALGFAMQFAGTLIVSLQNSN